MTVAKAFSPDVRVMASLSISLLLQSLVVAPCFAATFDVRQVRMTPGAGKQAGAKYVIQCGELLPGGGTLSSASYVIQTGCGATLRAVVSAAKPMPTFEPFALAGNRPNPFYRHTTIYYYLPAATSIRIDIFDLSGRLIRSIIPGEQGPGWQVAAWDGTDEGGRAAAIGLYHYRLLAGSSVVHGRMIKLQ